MKYPKFTREENLRCKLTDRQISEIREIRKQGFSQREIARMFEVGQHAIRRWLMTDEERVLYDKRYRHEYPIDKKDKHRKQLERKKRKFELRPKETAEYYRQLRENYLKDPIKRKMVNESSRRSSKKNWAKVYKTKRAWYLRNIEKLRTYERERKGKIARDNQSHAVARKRNER